MAYAQWVVIHIINSFRNGNISVKNAEAMCEFLPSPFPGGFIIIVWYFQ
jgi:hypothetical protein